MVLMVGRRLVVQAWSMEPDQATQAAGTRHASVVPVKESGAGAQLLLGAAEYVAHEDELLRLRGIRDRELPERLREARGFVAADAAEEIAHIQEERTVMDARIARLEELLHRATVIPDGEASDLVTLGATVQVVYPRKRRRATYRLTGTASASDARAVSARSPVGRALMGRRAGDVVSALLPGGRRERLEILGITAALAEAS
jgi:transcription elongation factor GreA